ncbi:hypothetical protein CGLO_09453 [Colletotrichum gloeosporioides Cg-14]|uniref:Protein kinase domain-containing protein n=1 Tax=Colletotrichum gloeosporioides (strain Cg-14) TaxID=1237896 RepID=T0K6E1_COLGC|nr:hypothetical protein CGLO_09453 [Colletotrichum gloeosporioides Cg-14]
MSAPDLARSIRRRLCDAEDNKEFVPDDAIQEFTSRNAVQTYLMANQQALPEDIAMQPLIDYVIDHDKPAKRVFLILELCNSMKYLTILRDAGFCDKDLPIEAKWSRDEDRYIVCTKVSSSNSKVTHAVFDSWIDNDIRFFRDTQWLFMAPVFVPNRFDYEMDNNCPLPIQKRIDHDKGGYSGAVYEVTIHQAHLQIELNGKGVASKEMHSAKREYFKKEADSLRLLHRLGHPHLIQPLAAYRRGNLLGFLFPWAGGGTLREFWEKHQRARTQDGMEALVRWVVSQLRGLSGATTAMHEENCRHTDLKPLNILLFEEETSLGTLCIADVGLAKIHEDDTEQRKLMNALATKARTGTERYIPPEFGHVNQLSRVFDVWSLGCVFLEFLIWTVYGWDELQNFIAGTKQFWQDRRGRLDSEVDKYIVHLKQVLDAENSSIALRECLRLVTDGIDFQIALLKQWIRVCDGEHNHQFDSHTKLPTRILDLGTAEKPLLCLRDGVSLGVAPYIALSHCWGTGNRFITLKSNLEEHKKHIGLELLPETFKDAVRIARALNYRFLWIDSLCIVQDDLQDWENEGASMEQVFSSANVTIAASSSASSEEGFLSVTRNQTASVTVRTPSNGTGFICKSIDNFHRDVESSVLNNRGWVFQERALSRRTIHFTSSQVYWECGNGIHCESLMKLKK